MNPIRRFTESRRIRQVAQEFLAVLNRARPLGVQLPVRGSAPEEVVRLAEDAAAWLVKQKQFLTLIRTGKTFTIYYRDDLDVTLSPETRKKLVEGHFLLTHDAEELNRG